MSNYKAAAGKACAYIVYWGYIWPVSHLQAWCQALVRRPRLRRAKREARALVKQDTKQRYIVRYDGGFKVCDRRELKNLANTIERRTGKRVKWDELPIEMVVV